MNSLQIVGDGDCFINSVLEQLSWKTLEDKELYKPVYLRRQVLMNILDDINTWGVKLVEQVAGIYGTVDENEAKSVKEWFYYMEQDKTWVDSLFILLLSALWGLKITVVRSDSLFETKFKHTRELIDSDLLVLFNSSIGAGHYNAIIRNDKSWIDCTHVKQMTGYDELVDISERIERGEKHEEWERMYEKVKERSDKPKGLALGDDEIVVKKERWNELLQKEKILEKIREDIESTKRRDSIPITPRKKRKLAVFSDSDEGDSKVPEIEEGSNECKECDTEYRSYKELVDHIRREHRGKYRYSCVECGQGLSTKESVKLHMQKHEGKTFECDVDDCNKSYSSAKSLRQHKEAQHSDRDLEKCEFCEKEFKTKALCKQHMLGCPNNQNKKYYRCGVSDCEYKHFLIKKVKDHRRKMHGL